MLLCTAGSGKSTWATRYVANHPEKHYALLSVDGIIKQIKVTGSPLLCKAEPPLALSNQGTVK